MSGPDERPLHPKYLHPCTRYVSRDGEAEHCGATPTRRYLNGHYCREHAPNAS